PGSAIAPSSNRSCRPPPSAPWPVHRAVRPSYEDPSRFLPGCVFPPKARWGLAVEGFPRSPSAVRDSESGQAPGSRLTPSLPLRRATLPRTSVAFSSNFLLPPPPSPHTPPLHHIPTNAILPLRQPLCPVC